MSIDSPKLCAVAETMVSNALFWKPRFAGGTATPHIPVLFWLIDALRPQRIVHIGLGDGTLYFASHQAIDTLELHARCYGFDPELIRGRGLWARRDACNADYLELSTEAGFEALDVALGGDVDLLVIEAVEGTDLTSLVTNWHPRLAARGVVVIHGIKDKADFPQFYDDFPVMRFDGGGCLTVLVVGQDVAPEVKGLAALEAGTPAHAHVHNIFGRLGVLLTAESFAAQSDASVSHADEYAASLMARRADDLQDRLNNAMRTLQDLRLERDTLLSERRTNQSQSEDFFLKEIEALKAKHRQGIDVLTVGLARQRERNVFLAKQLDKARKMVDRVRQDRKAASDALKQAKFTLEKTTQSFSSIKEERTKMLQSNSWKATAPMRKISALIRRRS
jgi:hypothetical protein